MNIKILNNLATIPTRGSDSAAGYDLYAATDYNIEILPHQTIKIGTGISIELEDGTFAGIYPRSGIATKRGLRPANTPGIIDSDYRGEIIVAIHNDSEYIQTIEAKERIAQMIVQKYEQVTFNIVNELTETDRGDKGFGSSGTK